jgi:thioredoxin reductase (NADPH)
LIPRTRNYPGFANGISGTDLLAVLRTQAESYGVTILASEAQMIVKEGNLFRVTGDSARVSAPRVVMATGLVDTRPEIEGFDAEADGSIVRYCPICDGFEATDKEICVIGNAEDAGGKAIFLRTFSNSVTFLTPDSPSGLVDLHGELADAGVRICEGPARLRQEAEKSLSASKMRNCVSIFYVPSWAARYAPTAIGLGALSTKVGCLVVDEHFQTTVPGLYAVGDVVSDLHQIAVGTGHAAIAATHIHNALPRNFR